MSSAGRIPSLDGLRAVSISLVLVAHLAGTAHFPASVDAVKWLNIGALGVRVFFVISGYLITSLLLGEKTRSGQIGLLRFYFRRSLRIFPPFYVLVAVVAALGVAGKAQLERGDVLHALTYTMNYHIDRGWSLGHSWSLSVEEQFYLLWPILVGAASVAAARQGLAGYILLAPTWRIALAVVWPASRPSIGETFLTTADALAAGCVLALARAELRAWAPYRRLVEGPLLGFLPLLILALSAAGARSTKFAWLVGMSAQNVLIMVLVDGCTSRSRDHGVRWLGAAPLVWLGTRSYSLYLWQQLFLDRASRSPWAAFPLNLLAALAMAELSYRLVELPALRLRERVEASLFPSTAGPA